MTIPMHVLSYQIKGKYDWPKSYKQIQTFKSFILERLELLVSKFTKYQQIKYLIFKGSTNEFYTRRKYLKVISTIFRGGWVFRTDSETVNSRYINGMDYNTHSTFNVITF